MEVNLLLTTLIPVVIFLPVLMIKWKNKSLTDKALDGIILGGGSWAITAIIIFLPSLLIYNSSNMTAYSDAITQTRNLLFWLIILFDFITEIFRFLGMKQIGFYESNNVRVIYFGIGWSIGEILTRYSFFFDDSYAGWQIILFYVYIFLTNITLTAILIRANENSKFFIFNVFIKLLIELGLFGLFGYGINANEVMIVILGMTIFQISMLALTLLARKYKMDD